MRVDLVCEYGSVRKLIPEMFFMSTATLIKTNGRRETFELPLGDELLTVAGVMEQFQVQVNEGDRTSITCTNTENQVSKISLDEIDKVNVQPGDEIALTSDNRGG
jgi:hypothetical protein